MFYNLNLKYNYLITQNGRAPESVFTTECWVTGSGQLKDGRGLEVVFLFPVLNSGKRGGEGG